MSLGQHAADFLARWLGSWRFVILQSMALATWIVVNSLSNQPVDPFPYILLNLALSTQAAFAAPVLQMSQNRADTKRDRLLEKIEEHSEILIQLLAAREAQGAGELSEGSE